MVKTQEQAQRLKRSCLAIKALCEQEYLIQKRQLFLWSPVFLALGIGFYFVLAVEVPLYFGLGFFVLTAGFMFLLKAQRLALIVPLLIVLGFLSAQLRTHMVHTPIIQKELGPVELISTIDVIERMEKGDGSRLTLSDVSLERLDAARTPKKVRLRLRKDPGYKVGERIKILAHLNVPSPPVIPGGFDFQRYLYFQEIGAVGFIYRPIETLEHNNPGFIYNHIERLRDDIALQAQEHIAPAEAGLAIALMVGRRTAIASEDAEAMRVSGLAHILAISGLHIGLFSGVLFFFTRFVMACVPRLALYHPIKKYAALFALGGAFIYMLLAGATVPTQRAFLMTGIVFMAIILDRSAISLRLVAFAAFVVLLFFPESLLSASFHMSFAAVTALVVFYKATKDMWANWRRRKGILSKISLYLAGVCATTMVASLATAPFALFHFQKVAVYSLLSNILVMPLVASLIMPFIVVSFFLLPFDLAFIPMRVIELGLEQVINVATWVSGLPSAAWLQPSWPMTGLVMLVLACLVLFLFKTRMRLLCVPFLALSLLLITLGDTYDVIISEDFKLVGYQEGGSSLFVSSLQKDRFARKSWLRRFGLHEDQVSKWPREGSIDGTNIICDEYACRWTQEGHQISYLKKPQIAAQECQTNDIILSPNPLKDCAAPYVIDFFDTYRTGAHGLILKGNVEIKTTQASRGERPWSAYNKDFQRWQ